MSIEERIIVLEQGLADTQRDFLVHLGEINRSMATLNKVVTSQELNNREINHNVTMLPGVASGQERDIKAMKNDLGIIRERVEHIDQRIDRVDRRLEGIEQRFTSLEEKFEQVLQQLATLTAKSE
jgi:chromosome segregation ATPase